MKFVSTALAPIGGQKKESKKSKTTKGIVK